MLTAIRNWSGAMPEYHEGQLEVTVSAAGGAAVAGPAAMLAAASVGAVRGADALSYYLRAGMLKSVTSLRPLRDAGPLFAPAALAQPAGMMAALLARAPHDGSKGAQVAAGVHFIEIAAQGDLNELQRVLANDPSFSAVARVPIRYLQATRRIILRDARRSPPPRSGDRPAPAAVAPAAGTMWNLQRMRWSDVHRGGLTNAGSVRVGVLDTGLDDRHPDLVGRFAGYRFYPDLGTVGREDIVGHGTHVAGTIVANFNNAFGINGLCTCALTSYKIFSDTTTLVPQRGQFLYVVDPRMYLRALTDALDDGMQVINLSIGGTGRPTPLEENALRALIASGTAVCAAMGNWRELGSPLMYPAAIDGVIAIGATRPNDDVTAFSNRGSHIWVSAPGEAIWSTLPTYPGRTGFSAEQDGRGGWREGRPLTRETDYAAWDGTSMATPHVAAASAMYLAHHGGGDGGARNALRMKAAKVPGMNGQDWDQDFGHGRLDLVALLS